MAGAGRAGRKGKNARTETHSRATPGPSSGTTIVDDNMNVVNPHQPGLEHTGSQYRVQEPQILEPSTALPYQSQRSFDQRSFDHPDMSRLSQEFEPMGIDDAHPTSRRSSTIAPAETDPWGAGIKHAMSVIAKLEALGLQKLDINLPKCVVLGEQSAGKSSVIEAISKIKTPRSTDTCTRCPLYIHMAPSDPHDNRWKAQVSLLKRFSYDGNAQHRPYRGWLALAQPEEQLFANADNLEDLEQVIAAAQQAIINPRYDPRDYLQGGARHGATDGPQAEFSPNIVRIKITGPTLANLSFYDLPGVIGQSPDHETQYLVQFVRSLVTEFVKQEDALVLVACSLANDVANSTAAGIARELNAPHRCVGVLTKPDCLPVGYKDAHLYGILSGTSFRLGHGYFVVKNPTQDQIDCGLSHAEARKEEEEYFLTAQPWASRMSNYKERFGTSNLQQYLSRELGAQMLKSLPTITAQIQAKLNEVDAELHGLPEAPTHNAVHEVIDVLRNFAMRVQQEMEGDHVKNKWVNWWEDLKASFDGWLSDMQPRLIMRPNTLDQGIYGASAAGASMNNSIVLDSEDEATHPPETLSKKRKLDSPTKAQEDRNVQSTPSGKAAISGRASNSGKASDFAQLRHAYELDSLSERIQKASKSRIPDQLQPKVLDQLIISTIQDWDRPLKRFFDEFKAGIFQHIQNVFDQEFRRWRDAPIYHEAMAIVVSLLESHYSEQETTMAAEALRDELEGPYMYHKLVWTNEKAAIHKRFKDRRYQVRRKQYFEELQIATGAELNHNQREAILKRDATLHTIFSTEPYALELEVVAKMKSYYLLASRRFHDAICMRIESRFLKVLRTGLLGELTDGLEIHTKEGLENCQRLLEEPPERKRKREELLRKRAKLIEGQNELNKKYDRQTTRTSTPAQNGFGRQTSFAPASTPRSDEMMDFQDNGYARRQDTV